MDEDAVALALVGTTIADKYRLISLLGAGGMGAVYEAEHVFTKRCVALKRMHQGIARSKHAAERFIREAQAPSTIGHPGIVQVLDGGFDSDGSLYLVLELLDGVSMEEALEQGALDAPSLLQIGIELLEALAAAHAKGFIHRDIKPDNVFLAEDGRGGVSVKLLDFGIASLDATLGHDKLTKTGSVLGTPLYMSPEQAQGARIDARSDLWSVGAMLYRALAGRAPYEGDTYNALIVSIVTRQHPPLSHSRPDLPLALLDVVERAMKKTPSDRFETAEQMCSALKIVSLHAEAGVPGSLSLSVRPPAGGRRRPAAQASPEAAAAGSGDGPALSSLRRRKPELDPARAAVGVEAALPVPMVLQRSAAASLRPQRRGSLGKVVTALGLGMTCVLAILLLRAKSVAVREARAQLTAADVAPAPSVPAQPPTNSVASTDRRAAPQGLPREALAAVLAVHEAELQHCLEEAVVTQMLAGATKSEPLRLDVTLNVTPTGRVSDVQVQGQAPADLTRCVRGCLSAAQFPAAEAPTVFRYPLVLAPTIVGQ